MNKDNIWEELETLLENLEENEDKNLTKEVYGYAEFPPVIKKDTNDAFCSCNNRQSMSMYSSINGEFEYNVCAKSLGGCGKEIND